mgnify:CR=1 FL=1
MKTCNNISGCEGLCFAFKMSSDGTKKTVREGPKGDGERSLCFWEGGAI